MGDGEAFKGDEKALHDNGKALINNGESLNGDDVALKWWRRGIKGQLGGV